jgi:predicted transposase YdaD
VIWVSLEELGQKDELDPLLNLLTLPVLLEPQLQRSSQQILERRPDLTETVFPILMQRHPHFTLEQMMVYVKIPTQELRHSRAAQELLAEGQARGEAKATLRQLTHRCGPLSPATTARIQALPLEQLEALGLALLDFSGADDLAAWLAQHAG